VRLTHFQHGVASLAQGHISDDGLMEWTFTGEVIEWRGPAPYLFVAMTPEESEDLKEAARGLTYWGQVPVHVTIGGTEFTTALFPGTGATSCPSRLRCSKQRRSERARSSRSFCVSTPRAGNDERMELRQPDHQIIAAEMVAKGDTATIRGPYGVGKRSERIFADSCRQRRGSARVGVKHRWESMTAPAQRHVSAYNCAVQSSTQSAR
jgi:Domain of unknown function (DUF1905)